MRFKKVLTQALHKQAHRSDMNSASSVVSRTHYSSTSPEPEHEPSLKDHTQNHHHRAEDVNSGKRHDAERDEGEETSLRRSDGLVGSSAALTTIEDVRALRVKLETLLRESGLKVDLDLEVF